MVEDRSLGRAPAARPAEPPRGAPAPRAPGTPRACERAAQSKRVVGTQHSGRRTQWAGCEEEDPTPRRKSDAPASHAASRAARLLALRFETPRAVFARSCGRSTAQLVMRRTVHSSVTACAIRGGRYARQGGKRAHGIGDGK